MEFTKHCPNVCRVLHYIKTSNTFFDLDGTLGELHFGANKCLEYPENPNKKYYEFIRPIAYMQRIVDSLNEDRVFVLSAVSSEKEIQEKRKWLLENYPTIPKSHQLFVMHDNAKQSGILKAEAIRNWCKENKQNVENTILIEDSIDNIESVETSGIPIRCFHTSSLID